MKKYKNWLDALSAFGINSFNDVWGDLNRNGESDFINNEIMQFLFHYKVCGKDNSNRDVLWIAAAPIPIEIEKNVMKASCIYFYTLHCDLETLRNGITMIMDTRKRDYTKKIGNENKCQKVWMSMPTRPQSINILEPSMIKRTIINSLFYLASFFTSEKIISRIRFGDENEVKELLPLSSLPQYVGGEIPSDVNILIEWIQKRLKRFSSHITNIQHIIETTKIT